MLLRAWASFCRQGSSRRRTGYWSDELPEAPKAGNSFRGAEA
jgi:hypothetical protein